jgi:uncharacterized membrane protein
MTDPSETGAHAAPRAIVTAIALAAGAWILIMAAIVLAAGPDAAAAGGWRLALLKQGSITAFVVALIAGAVAVVVLERRAPRR